MTPSQPDLVTELKAAMPTLSGRYVLPANPRFLIARTDNLGDVVLTLPLCGLIKQVWPTATVGFVGKPYTQPILEACHWVDQFWDRADILSSTEAWQGAQYDVVIFVFPDRALAQAVKHIKWRVGTSHRWWHWLTCNIRPSVGRKSSDLHEAQLNVGLLAPFFNPTPVVSLAVLGQLFGLAPQQTALISLPIKLPQLNANYVVLHPKSAGSAREWPLVEYAKLAHNYTSKGYQVVITGTEKEGANMKSEATNLFDHTGVIDATGQLTLAELIALLSRAQQVVACSTGPLHIASALGVSVIGLYPPIRPMHPGRWAPLGPKVRVLVADEACQDCRKTQDCHCIKALRVEL